MLFGSRTRAWRAQAAIRMILQPATGGRILLPAKNSFRYSRVA
jgi:hypothetical protein